MWVQKDGGVNRSLTDVAGALRQRRLGEVCGVVSEVEQALGITRQVGHWDHLASLPAMAWVPLLMLVGITLGLLLARGLPCGPVRSRMLRRRRESTL